MRHLGHYFNRSLIAFLLSGALLALPGCNFMGTNFNNSAAIGGLSFEGLLQKNAILAADGKSISLSWKAAIGNRGNVTYIIYKDAAFTEIAAQTSATTWTDTTVSFGNTYNYGARAQDQYSTTGNTNYVTIVDKDPNTPPVFAGLKVASAASQNSIVLKWDPCPQETCNYNIYKSTNLTSSIADTTRSSYDMTGLSPNSYYEYVVRATNAAGCEDTNTVKKGDTTLAYSVPSFGGITAVSRIVGTPGLTTLTLSWIPSSDPVTGYIVYQGSASDVSDPFSYTQIAPDGAATDPIAGFYVAGASTSSVTVSGLTQGTTYYFVVRAFISMGSSVNMELNRLEASDSTLSVTPAVGMAGIHTATPAAGTLGFTAVDVGWLPPDLTQGGVYDSFRVDYEPGKCNEPFSSSPSSKTINLATTFATQVTGLTPETDYRFRVRATYAPAGIEDSNTACLSANTTPPYPVFTGVASVTSPVGVSAFNSLNISWPQATSSFTQYYVEASTTPNFAADAQTAIVGFQDATVTSLLMTGLTANTLYYIRVTAQFTYTSITTSITLAAGTQKVLTGTTTPIIPNDEKITAVNITSSTSLVISWSAPSNTSALYSNYKLWKACSNQASTDVLTDFSNNPAGDETFPKGQGQTTDYGLISNVQCCYMLRAYYQDPDYTLGSNSTDTFHCATPSLIAPPFNGIVSAARAPNSSGFTTVNVTWTPVQQQYQALFSRYEFAWSTQSNNFVWCSDPGVTCTQNQLNQNTNANGNTSEPNMTVGTTQFSNIPARETIFFRVRAVNAYGSPQSTSGGTSAVQSVPQTPLTPSGGFAFPGRFEWAFIDCTDLSAAF